MDRKNEEFEKFCDQRFICPKCGLRSVEVIVYGHAWEYSDDFELLGLKEDEELVVYHCLNCEEDLLIQRGL